MVDNKQYQDNKKRNRQLPKFAPQRHGTHKILWLVIFAVLIVTAVIIVINVFKPVDFKDKPTDQTTNETTKTEKVNGATKDSSGKDENNEAPDTKTTTSDGTPIKNEGNDPNTSETITGAITFSDISENHFLIRVNIDQYLTSGTCDLTLISNTIEGVSYTQQVPIIPSVSSSTCDGFDYEVSDIRKGNYSIKINLTSGNKKGTITGEANL